MAQESVALTPEQLAEGFLIYRMAKDLNLPVELVRTALQEAKRQFVIHMRTGGPVIHDIVAQFARIGLGTSTIEHENERYKRRS